MSGYDELDRLIAVAFGREPAPNAVERDVREALRGASVPDKDVDSVLFHLASGAPLREALTLASVFTDAPGAWQLLDADALARDVSRFAPAVGGPAQSGALVEAAREELVEAHLQHGRTYIHEATEDQRRRVAESAARGFVDEVTKSAIRDGWGMDELAERIRTRAAEVRDAPSSGPRRDLLAERRRHASTSESQGG